MEIEFQAQIFPKEKQQQLLSSLIFFLAIAGSFCLFLLLIHPNLILSVLGCVVSLYGIVHTSIPYFKLRKQLLFPDRLQLSQDNVIFITNQKKTLQFPLSSIQQVIYREGLIFFLQNAKYTLLDPRFELAKFLRKGKLRGGDLFFEYFDASVQARLQDIVQMEKPHHPRTFQHR